MFVDRDAKRSFEQLLGVYNVVAVVGPRQAGKTTFLKEELKGKKAAYVTFDDPDSRKLFDEDVKKFESQYMEGFDLTVLDEVQYCKEAGQKLKYLADKGRKIWVTSSSQVMLSNEVLSWLVGRVSIVKLYPFSLQEFWRAKGQKEFTSDVFLRGVWEHVVYGGYPKVVLSEGAELKATILSDLRETMILKDVARAFSLEDLGKLEDFCKYLSHVVGGVVAPTRIASEIGISFQTVKKYLNALEKSYLVSTVAPFYTNKTKEVTKNRKVYFVDTGMRNAVAGEFPLSLDNQGKLFENYVFTELLRAGFSIKYWRTPSGAEVDFIIEKGNVVVPIEVKLRSTGKVERSLRSFIGKYSPKEAFVVFYQGQPSELKVDNCRVVFTDIQQLLKHLNQTTP